MSLVYQRLRGKISICSTLPHPTLPTHRLILQACFDSILHLSPSSSHLFFIFDLSLPHPLTPPLIFLLIYNCWLLLDNLLPLQGITVPFSIFNVKHFERIIVPSMVLLPTPLFLLPGTIWFFTLASLLETTLH